MTISEMFSLPLKQIHLVSLDEAAIVALYKDVDEKANAATTMSFMYELCNSPEIAERMGPIVIENATGTVLDGRNLLVAIHGYLLASGRQSIKTQIYLI